MTTAPPTATSVPGEGGDLVLGDVTELLRVHEHLVVHGRVMAGASLAWGARLVVLGGFAGPAHLSPHATLEVVGTHAGERVGADGLVLVSGRCSLAAATEPGTGVLTGTVMVDDGGRCWSVDEDGSLRSVGPGRSQSVDAATDRRTMRWSVRRDRFVEL